MEKLIKLLNEFDKPLGWYYEDWVLDCKLNLYEYMAYEWICSARYGFIKWLVENDKIDLRKLDCKRYDVDIPARYYLWTYIRYSIEKEMLMTLAIQDEPIKFLISILKNVEKSD